MIRALSDVMDCERLYNGLALRACNSINKFICEHSKGDTLLTIALNWQYKYINNSIPSEIIELLEDICVGKYIKDINLYGDNNDNNDNDSLIVNQILLWIRNRLDEINGIPKLSNGKIILPFVAITIAGSESDYILERKVKFFSYLNTLKTFLFEIRSHVTAVLKLSECIEYLNGNEDIPDIKLKDLEDLYSYYIKEIPNSYSKPAADFFMLFTFQKGGLTEVNGVKGICLYDYQNHLFNKVVNFAAYVINESIVNVKGWRNVIVSHNRISNMKQKLQYEQLLKYYETYFMSYAIKTASDKHVSYKKMCNHILRQYYSPLDEFISISLLEEISETERKTRYADFLYIKAIFENVLEKDLDAELQEVYSANSRKKDNADNTKNVITIDNTDSINNTKNVTIKDSIDNITNTNNIENEVTEKRNIENVETANDKIVTSPIINSDELIDKIKNQIEDIYNRLSADIQRSNASIKDNINENTFQINKRIDDIEEVCSVYFEDIEQTCSQIMSTVNEMSNRMAKYDKLIVEACNEKKEKPLTVLIKNKIDEYRNMINEKCPNLEIDDWFLFSLSLLVCPNALSEIDTFLEEINQENYRLKYLSKISAKGVTVYSFESNLGICSIYKKSGKLHIIHLDIYEKYQMKEVNDFISKCAKNCFADIYYDADIFVKLEELLTEANKSIHMIVPWVFEYPAIKCYGNILRNAERRGVSINLKYGYLSQGSKSSSNQQSIDNFKESTKNVLRLKEEFVPSLNYKDDDTHIKALVIDERVAFIGSCNYLSYRHDYINKPDFRHETMVLLDSPELASAILAYYES